MVGIICPPPGRNRVKLGAKPWCGPVPMPTGAPASSLLWSLLGTYLVLMHSNFTYKVGDNTVLSICIVFLFAIYAGWA